MQGLVELCDNMNHAVDAVESTDSHLRVIPKMYGGRIRAIEVRTVDYVYLKERPGDP